MFRILSLLLLFATNSVATEIIGSESLVTLPAEAHYAHIINFRPGAGQTVDINPPIFSWSYVPNPADAITDTSQNSFLFEIDDSSDMSSPIFSVETLAPCYNYLAPLTPGNTYYWRIDYRNMAETHEAYSDIRSFTVAADATEWDRSMFANANITGGSIEADDEIYTKSSHGITDGAMVRLISLTGGTGLTAGTVYFFHVLSANTGTLHTSHFAAVAGTGAVNVTSDATSVVLEYCDYLADKAAHPHMLFNASNKAAVAATVTAHADWAAIISVADTAIAHGDWPLAPGGSVQNWSFYLLNVALAWQMTGDTDYSDADPEVGLVAMAEAAVDNDPLYAPVLDDWIADSDSGAIMICLAFCYDWLYDLMNDSQRATVLHAMMVRCRFITKAMMFEYPTGTFGGSAAGDITGAYPNPSDIVIGWKFGHSHEVSNMHPDMALALSAYGESEGCRELLDFGLHYFIGHTFFKGTFGAPHEGRSYSAGDLFSFGYGGLLSAFMRLAITFPEANLDLHPYWNVAGDWMDRLIPVGFEANNNFGSWGDAEAGGIAWTSTGNDAGRNLSMFTQNGIFREHQDNQAALTGSSGRDALDICYEHHWSMPAAVETYEKSQLFLNDGYVAANSIIPNQPTAYTDGVGFVFQARPPGSEGGHGNWTDMQVEMWAYGANLTQHGHSLSSVSDVSWTYNSIVVDGIGQANTFYGGIEAVYSQILAYKATDDFVYTAGEFVECYNDVADVFIYGGPSAYNLLADNGDLDILTKVQRHVLFMRGKYWVIWDDLAATEAARWDWVWRLRPYYKSVTENVGADTMNATAHGLVNDAVVRISGSPLHADFDDETDYYVVNAAANSFQLSLTQGGSAINITGTSTNPVVRWSANLSGSPSTTFNYYVPGADGAVRVYVQHIATGAGISLTRQSGSNAYTNPVTAENYISDAIVAVGPYLLENEGLWVHSNSDAATFSFCTVVFPVNAGDSAPTITRIDDATARIEHAGYGIDDTISFDPDNVTADFVVNLAGGATGTINATTGNVGTVNLQ